jgi:uncharacterized protein with PQ loop repeat
MTREEVSLLIHWPTIIWLFGIINVGGMLPQLIKLVRTKETKGLSVGMIYIYMFVQISFSLEGFFQRNDMLMWCLGISALVSLITIILYYSYRGSES